MRAFHCPGHTADHMVFVLEEESAMFTGDNVLGHGTAVFENLTVYLDSLSRMREQFRGRAYPGHVGNHFAPFNLFNLEYSVTVDFRVKKALPSLEVSQLQEAKC